MENKMMKNPWLGLQTYKEGDVLYGRDDDIRNLSQYIMTDSETVLFGKSGIGKSSVLNAGVIPMARIRGFVPISIRLAHNSEAESYTVQIYEKIKSAGVECGEIKEGIQLWELFHGNAFRNEKGEGVKLLLLFDQFEEIFTLQQNAQKKINFFRELADHINDVMPRSLSGETSSANSREKLKDIKLNEKEEGTEIVLDDMDFSLYGNSVDYSYDNDIHIVLTLREDFLSEFEYYTSSIPSFKQHRYGLRPINDEQAAEIILKPRQGLVSKDVAKLIIEKVTKRIDFALDGKPEIEVNSAVLSLYLSKFYDKSGGMAFTKELIEKEAGNIINEFYCDCVKDIPEDIVERIENELVNKEGHRENKSLRGLSEELGAGNYISMLIDKKLLGTFQYAGETKVEFIHDILCDVVQNRKEQKEKRKEEELERQRLDRLNRRNTMRLFGVSGILVLALFAIAYLVFDNNKLKNEKGFGDHQVFTISFIESQDVTIANEFWHGYFKLEGKTGSGKDSVFFEIKNFNKTYKDSVLRFSADSIKSFVLTLQFDKESNNNIYKDIVEVIPISDFTEKKEKKVSIDFDVDKMKIYPGKVFMKIDGVSAAIQEATVVLRGQAVRTDRDGIFKFTFKDALACDEKIYILHEGFKTIEGYALNKDDGKWYGDFEMVSSDSLSGFRTKCNESEYVDSTKNWNYWVVSKCVNVNNAQHKPYLCLFAVKYGTPDKHDHNIPIKGYYYYSDEYNMWDKKGDRYLSYYVFTGWVKEKSNKSQKYGAFKVEGRDKVGNKQMLTGTIPYQQDAHKATKASGYVVSLNDTVYTFGNTKMN